MSKTSAIGIAVLVVVAGCVGVPTAGPPGDQGATSNGTVDGSPGSASPSISVRGADLSVDPNATFRRLQGVADTNVSPPGYLRAIPDSELDSAGGNDSGATDPGGRSFRSLVGIVPHPDRRGDLRYEYPARTGMTGVVSVYPGDKPRGLVETILAHELVHYLQFHERHGVALRRNLSATTDGQFVYRSVLEGTAVVLTDRYVERHVPNVTSNSALYRRIDAAVPPGTPAHYGNDVYRFGTRYVSGRLDDPGNFESVVERPPNTSEQVIHGYAPGEEPPRPLSVSVETGDHWRFVGSDVKGEAFVRVALQNGLSEADAAEAAAGWGNDSLGILRPDGGGDPAYAWVLRWDDPGNATEFVDAMETSLTHRGNRSGEYWQIDGRTYGVDRPADDVAVLLVGNRSFVRRTKVEADGGSVVVTPGPPA